MNNKDTIIKTFTELAPRYEEVVDSELTRFWGWSYQSFVGKLIEMSPIQEEDLVLDIATGTGVIPFNLLKLNLTSNRIHGLDITLSMLKQARQRFSENGNSQSIDLVCASAMEMPYSDESFNIVISGLAAHHMDVKKLITEAHRVLQRGGILTIADVGGSPLWRFPGVKGLVKIAAFLYYFLKEDASRAWAEASAVSNVLSLEEWFGILSVFDFSEYTVTRLTSKYSWIPEPVIINATKSREKK
jgi:ubiquinone/menaquinone biosynthesis C-methylase UbiE